jgi:hypothetical protein
VGDRAKSLVSLSFRRAFLLAAAAIALAARPASSHPLHTSLAELTYDARAKEIRISIRVFTDDLTKASAAYAKSKSIRSSAVDAYSRAMFVVVDRDSRAVQLVSCGSKPVSDLTWLCYRASAPRGPSGFKVAHKILFDLYSDQINLVQAAYNGKKQSLLFVKGDRLKRID